MGSGKELVTTVHNISLVLDKGGQVDVLFLDFCKAYDKVSHSKLFLKLELIGLPDYLINLIASYLKNREQFVDIKGCHSRVLPVNCGVPQGSVLGPLLFLIYINDLTEDISSSVSVRLFADDCIIFKQITSTNDHHLLQQSIDNISSWCHSWDMQLNVEKTVLLRVTRKKTPSLFEYCSSNTPIQAADSYKYLGVTFTHKLTWTKHISRYVRRHLRSCASYAESFVMLLLMCACSL